MPLRLHYNLEKLSMGLVAAIIVAASVGAIVEIVPLFTLDETVTLPDDLRPHTPLELAGREIYIREGCYACHSQMIRSLADEIDRYGPYSLAAESAYDHPMLWGSKRTGPDIARLGGKYSDAWHVRHLIDPRAVVPASIMPVLPLAHAPARNRPHPRPARDPARLGVPYDEAMVDRRHGRRPRPEPPGLRRRRRRAGTLRRKRRRARLRRRPSRLTEMDAVVAYLQALGTLTDAAHAEAAR